MLTSVNSYSRYIRIFIYNFRFITFNYIYIYISRFSHCTKLSQCREQEGSATLVIVTMHLLSTLPISERYSSYDILFATLHYDVGLFCQDLLSLTVKHLTLALLFPPLLSPLFSPSGGRRNVSKRKITQCSLQ